MSFGIFGLGKGTVKESVVLLLYKEWPLTGKQLHSRLKREFGLDCSFQAVFKALKELQSEGVVLKSKDGFSLDKDWIAKNAKFAKELESTHSTDFGKIENPWEKDLLNLSFSSPNEFGRFIVYKWFDYPAEKGQANVAVWNKFYSLIGLNDDEVLAAKTKLSKLNYCVICCSKTKMDELFASAFQEFGVKVKLGVEFKTFTDYIVQGNHVMEVYWPKSRRQVWKKLFESSSPPKFDLQEILRQMHAKSLEPIQVTILKSKDFAGKLREEVLGFF